MKFDTAEHARAAISALNGSILHDNEIKVEHARPRRVRRTRRVRNENPLKVYLGNLPVGYDPTAISSMFKGVVSIASHDK